MEAVVVFLVAIAAIWAFAKFVVHLFSLGAFYIEFDGLRYWLWQRGFLGFNRCLGLYETEDEARAFIEKFERDPPRTINL